MTYEAAFERLSAIVEAMEAGDLALETLIEHYEKAMLLRKVCIDKLAQAEIKIKSLEEKSEGAFSLKSLTLDEDSD